MIGKTISHYKNLEEIGRGGMGVVYKAEDTKLHRTVALKFLPPEFTRDADAKERFSREAQAAAALNHANICTVFEIDEHEGQSFIAMEYVEGRSLKELIAEGPMPLKLTVDIAMQIARGLAEAHEKDVVHRDIKSANIMFNERGDLKIMDFGLAKLRNQTVLTRENTTLGTVAYMSPEQAHGDDIDHRTDIWALGVVLYEMVSGQRPFRGEYDQAMIYSVLNSEPEPLTSVRTGVPVELGRIVTKALEKDPDERYQTAADFIADLRHLGRIMEEQSTFDRSVRSQAIASREAPAPRKTPLRVKLRWLPWVAGFALAAAVAISVIPRFFESTSEQSGERADSGMKMLVVLPFDNLGAPEDEYFAGGITDAITARLAGLSGLGVISRQSAIQYKDSPKSSKEIGEELGVDYILEGTIQRERQNDPESRVRIIPQLIRCADDIHLWAGTYDEDMAEVFRLQSDIAERVARELDITLLGQERTELSSKPTDNIEAYEYYLRGIEYSDRHTSEEDSRRAVLMFEKAVELDSGFADAWARLSRSYTWLYWLLSDDSALNRARVAVGEALHIDPGLLEAHLALGTLYYHGNLDFEKALEHFHIVQKKQPNNEEALRAIGFIRRRQGRWEEALSNIESAQKINPRSIQLFTDGLAGTLLRVRRYTEAEKYINLGISMAPDNPDPYITKAELAIHRDGDSGKACKYLMKAIELTNPTDKCLYILWLSPEPISRICFESPCGILDLFEPANCNLKNIYLSWYYLAQAECSLKYGRREEASAFIDSIHGVIENAGHRAPHIAESFSSLGLLYARLGLKEEAIREGIRAIEEVPVSKDAMVGPTYIFRLAEIYSLVGEYEAAIDQLEQVLSVPCEYSVNLLRLDPMWDPLRDHPRFKKLLDKYSNG